MAHSSLGRSCERPRFSALKHYNNLELIYWTSNGGVELPLEDWQYKVIAQVLGLSVQEDESGNITFSHFPKDFVMKRIEKMGVLIPVDGKGKT